MTRQRASTLGKTDHGTTCLRQIRIFYRLVAHVHRTAPADVLEQQVNILGVYPPQVLRLGIADS